MRNSKIQLPTIKLLLLSMILLSSFSVVSQDIDRDHIVGKIIVEGDDIEGITIYNASSNKGTVTDANGRFMLSMALNDHLEIRALEYQSIDIKVNSDIISSKKMQVYLIEKMNILEEVVVTNKELSGRLVTDASRLETFNPKRDVFYFGISKNEVYGLSDDSDSQVRQLDKNEQGQTMVNGLNVVNVVDQLLIPLFRAEVKNKKEAGVPEVPAEYIKSVNTAI